MLDVVKCHDCGYDLRSHPPGRRCPECGRVVSEPPEVLNPGFRFLWVFTSALLASVVHALLVIVAVEVRAAEPKAIWIGTGIIALIMTIGVMAWLFVLGLKPGRWSTAHALAISALTGAIAMTSCCGGLAWFFRDFD